MNLLFKIIYYFEISLNFMLRVTMLNIIVLSVIMLSVVASFYRNVTAAEF